jgi:hypothetical protein
MSEKDLICGTNSAGSRIANGEVVEMRRAAMRGESSVRASDDQIHGGWGAIGRDGVGINGGRGRFSYLNESGHIRRVGRGRDEDFVGCFEGAGQAGEKVGKGGVEPNRDEDTGSQYGVVEEGVEKGIVGAG